MPWRRLAQRYPRLGTFVRRRLDADEVLGWHLTLGLLLAVGGIALFALIAHAAGATPDQASIDAAWNQRFNRHALHTPTSTDLFQFITDLGDTWTLILVVVSVLLALLACTRRRREGVCLAALWLGCTAGGALLNFLLKDVFQRQRPSLAAIQVGGWSFPSGHAMGAMVVYGMLAYLLLRVVRRPAVRKLIVAGAVLLVGLIGFSRVYLGAHWVSDVLGGWTAGAVWLALCISLAETLRRQRGASGEPS